MSDYFPSYDKRRMDIITSSHGKEEHFLPDFLIHEFYYQFKFTQPFIDAWGGRRLDDQLVRHILKRIDRNFGLNFPQCLVIMLGNLVQK